MHTGSTYILFLTIYILIIFYPFISHVIIGYTGEKIYMDNVSPEFDAIALSSFNGRNLIIIIEVSRISGDGEYLIDLGEARMISPHGIEYNLTYLNESYEFNAGEPVSGLTLVVKNRRLIFDESAAFTLMMHGFKNLSEVKGIWMLIIKIRDRADGQIIKTLTLKINIE